MAVFVGVLARVTNIYIYIEFGVVHEAERAAVAGDDTGTDAGYINRATTMGVPTLLIDIIAIVVAPWSTIVRCPSHEPPLRFFSFFSPLGSNLSFVDQTRFAFGPCKTKMLRKIFRCDL